jgi:hypothetical protein
MGVVLIPPISLSRSDTIGQDEVEEIFCTIFSVVFKANECMEDPRLEPLLEERGFIEKLKQSSAISLWANNLRFFEKWNLQK